MDFSYIKLNAKKRLVKNNLKSFMIAFLPYVTIFLLTVLNYYLYIFLKQMNFTVYLYISSYAIYIKATLLTLSVCASFVLWKIVQLNSNKYFYCKNVKTHIKLRFNQYTSAITVSILKFFLSVAWAGFYLMPCIVVSATLYYCINVGEYTFNVMLTLFVSAVILFVIGASFLYVTLKRYSMCNFVIFTRAETDAIKIMAKSTELIENNMVRFAFYSLSFIGWILSCMLVIPALYVLPYIKMANYSYFKTITTPQKYKTETQKPIIFYIAKKEKV